MKLIAGSSNPQLAAAIAAQLSIPMIDVELSCFANGEKRVWIKESVKGENVVLVQSFSEPTDQNVMEFLLLADSLERLGARHINAVIPWFGYSLQDKVFREGEPIAAKVIADLVSHAHIKRVFLLDLHNTSITGFFSIPAHHLSPRDLFAQYVRDHFDLSQAVIASPDFGGLKRARVFAEMLGLELVNVDKHRDLKTGTVTALAVNGDVSNKIVIVLDDVINSGSTVVSCAKVLKQHGAKEVHFFATHGPLVKSGIEKMEASQADSVVVSNSIPLPTLENKIKSLDVSSLFVNELKTWL